MNIDKKDLLNVLNKSPQSFEVSFFKNKVASVFFEYDSSFDDDKCYLECLEKGISLLFEELLLKGIHLHFDKEDGYEDYSGWISDYFSEPNISYDDVVNLMGKSTRSGGGEKGFMGVAVPFWLRYDYPEYAIHYTFTEDNKNISLVTIMPNKKFDV